MTVARRLLALVLLLIAAYAIFIVLRASFFTSGHGPVFWTAIGMFVVPAAVALWGARRLR